MSKHTTEPWLVKYQFNVFDKDGDTCLAACGGRSSNRDGEGIVNENIANAARIVLCVNAMSGIASAAPGSVERLVEAAKAIDAMTPKTYSHDYLIVMVREVQALARAALAAITVEGGGA